jgi:hypothetical protein
MPAYAAVLGLGGYCQVAHQLARAGVVRIHSPFDWLVTPIDAVSRVVRERGAGFCEKISRYDNGLNKGRHVLCESYGVVSAHDFPLDADNAPDLSAAARVRAKLIHKTGMMLDACAAPGRKLFVRLGGVTHRVDPWPYLRDDAPLRASTLGELCVALQSVCADGFDLLLVTYQGVTKLAEDVSLPVPVVHRTLPIPAERIWEGSEAAWAEVLTGLPFDLPRTLPATAMPDTL